MKYSCVSAIVRVFECYLPLIKSMIRHLVASSTRRGHMQTFYHFFS